MANDALSTTIPVDAGREASPRSVTAFFDTGEAADQARLDLVRAGVPDHDIKVAGGQAAAVEPAQPHGFWETLKDFFVPDEDRHMYAEGLRRGGVAVSVQTDSAAYDRVLEILDRDGAIDMEERAGGWRDEGWTASGGAEPLGNREMAYEPAGSGTGGFTASRAEQPLFDGPMDNAAIEPGSVTPAEPDGARRGTESPRAAASAPDTAYAAAAPGLASPADPSRDSTAMPGTLQPAPSASAPLRDLSHGRTRVRSYRGGDLPGDAPSRG